MEKATYSVVPSIERDGMNLDQHLCGRQFDGSGSETFSSRTKPFKLLSNDESR